MGSSLTSDRLEVHCLEHPEPIVSPLILIYIGNGCKGYSTGICKGANCVVVDVDCLPPCLECNSGSPFVVDQ